MAGAQKDQPGDLSQGRVQAVRKQWAVHEDGALAYQMQNEEITEHYGLNRFHRRMVREDIPVAKFVQTEEELQQQEERLRELEVLKIQAEEDAKLAQKISRHMKRESRDRGRYDNRHRGAREVRNPTDHEIINFTDHEIRNRADHEIRNRTDHETRNRTDHEIRNRTDHEIRNRTDHEIRNRTDNDVGNHHEHVVGDHQIKSRTDHDVRTPTFHDVRTPAFHDVRNYTDHDVRNYTDHDVRNYTDHDVRNYTDHDVRNYTDHDVRSHADDDVRNYTDHDVRRGMDNDVKNYRDHDVRSHADDDVRRNHLYQEARNRTDLEARNRTDIEARNRTDIEARNRTDIEARNRTDIEARNRADIEARNRTDLEARNRTDIEARNRTDLEARNRTDIEARNWADIEARNRADIEARNRADLEARNRADLKARNRTDLEARNRTDLEARNRTDIEAINRTVLEARNNTDHEIRNRTDHEARNRTGNEVRNRTGNEVRNRTDHEVLDDEELARQLQEKEQRKYERHLERKKEKKLKKERQVLEAALAKDLEDARLAVNPENGGDGVSASMESLNLQGVSVTRITAAGQIEDNGDFSDFYKLPDEMDEVTRMEIQASQDEELARLLQEQEHKRTKAKVDPEKMRRIELHDQQLARIIQEEDKLRMRKAKQKHQARKEARRLLTGGEALPLGASANFLNQQQQFQECPADPPPAAVPVVSSSGQQRYRSNSYTKACDSPPSPARSPARKHRASPRVGEDPERPRVPSHESIAPNGGPDHKHQHYPKSLNEKQASTSSSTSSPIAAQSSSGRGLSTLETARQIAAGNPEGILAIQNSHKNTGDRMRRTEQDRFMRSQEMLDIDRLPVQGQHTGRSARRGSDPYRQVTEVRSDAAIYALPYKPHGVLLGSELRQLEVADVHGYLTDESGSSSGSVSRLSRLHQVHQYHQHQQLQQQQGDSLSQEDAGPQIHPAPSGLAEFNIVAALDPTYQRRHPEACLLPETQIQSQVPFSRSLPQADGDLEWDPNLRGSLRKPKAQVHGYHDPTTIGSLGHENAIGGEPVMSSWQPVQGQRRRDPGTRGKAQPRNVPGSDKKGNCKQQ